MHEAPKPAAATGLENAVHKDTEEWCFNGIGDMSVQPGDIVAVWWTDRGLHSHDAQGNPVPDDVYVKSPGWARATVGFHILGQKCDPECGTCPKCVAFDTWKCKYKDGLEDRQPLKAETYGLQWVMIKGNLFDPLPEPVQVAAGPATTQPATAGCLWRLFRFVHFLKYLMGGPARTMKTQYSPAVGSCIACAFWLHGHHRFIGGKIKKTGQKNGRFEVAGRVGFWANLAKCQWLLRTLPEKISPPAGLANHGGQGFHPDPGVLHPAKILE